MKKNQNEKIKHVIKYNTFQIELLNSQGNGNYGTPLTNTPYGYRITKGDELIETQIKISSTVDYAIDCAKSHINNLIERDIRKNQKRENVYVDVFYTEDDNEIYFLGKHITHNLKNKNVCADVCYASGFFIDEEMLDDFLHNHSHQINVVCDYRKDV